MNQAPVQNVTAGQGLSLLEKEAFIRGTLSPLARQTFPYACSIFGSIDAKAGRHYGSGLRCELAGRRAILTALHVIEDAKAEPLGVAISTEYGKPPYVVHGAINIDTVADLAVYFLPSDYPCPGEAFWPSARIDRTRDKLSTDYLFLHGFPGKTSYSSQFLGGVVLNSLPYGAMQRLEDLPADVQPFQFAVEYDPIGMANDRGVAEDLVDPHGLSGSPVWRIGVSGNASRDWTPRDCVLVGIVTQWRPDEKVLVATSVERLPPSWCLPVDGANRFTPPPV